MKNILYVGYRDRLHSSVGGYDHIIENPNTYSLLGENVWFGNIPVNTRGKFLNLLALDAVMRWKRLKYDVCHIFYGDTLLLPYLKLSKHKIVATIHMGLDYPRKNQSMFFKTLKSLDGVVVLSTNQQKQLKEQYNIDAVYIPHGFNSPVFKKCETTVNRNYINLVVLGQNYRDYKCLQRALDYCKDNCRNIKFHFIGQPKWFKDKIGCYSNAVIYPRLDDDMYFSVIDDCDYNFLPVTFATANNALLEAQFLGVRSILPKLAGIDDYAAPAPLNMFYSSDEELFSLFNSLTKCEKSQDIIKYVEKFKWANVYTQLNEYYESL